MPVSGSSDVAQIRKRKLNGWSLSLLRLLSEPTRSIHTVHPCIIRPVSTLPVSTPAHGPGQRGGRRGDGLHHIQRSGRAQTQRGVPGQSRSSTVLDGLRWAAWQKSPEDISGSLAIRRIRAIREGGRDENGANCPVSASSHPNYPAPRYIAQGRRTSTSHGVDRATSTRTERAWRSRPQPGGGRARAAMQGAGEWTMKHEVVRSGRAQGLAQRPSEYSPPLGGTMRTQGT
ncbi:hypothetical protein DFH06DRAFT_1123773 [Mycena polygramma]|nr:hypothetical protein DFH06DRAFT_1123773 [Mycena polygramma]